MPRRLELSSRKELRYRPWVLDAWASLEMAQRAKSICSEIARTNIAYRDIRDRRREVDEVIGAING